LPHDAVLARYYVAMSPCLFLPPSVTSRYCIETIGLIEMVLAWKLPSTYPTLCYKPKEIRVPPKIREIPSGSLSQTLDWKKIRHGIRSCQQNLSTIELADDTCDGRRVVADAHTWWVKGCHNNSVDECTNSCIHWLHNSIPRRLRAVVASKGNITKY